MKSIAINLSLFKVGWLAVVFAAAAGLADVGIATIALIVIVHLVRAKQAVPELGLLAVAAVIGLAWESLLVSLGALEYPNSQSALAPFWIVAMWVLFATTLNVGMSWLRKNYAVAAAAGAVGGPLSFLAGEKAGAVILNEGSLVLISLGWMLLLPAMAAISVRLDGYTKPHGNLVLEGS